MNAQEWSDCVAWIRANNGNVAPTDQEVIAKRTEYLIFKDREDRNAADLMSKLDQQKPEENKDVEEAAPEAQIVTRGPSAKSWFSKASSPKEDAKDDSGDGGKSGL